MSERAVLPEFQLSASGNPRFPLSDSKGDPRALLQDSCRAVPAGRLASREARTAR